MLAKFVWGCFGASRHNDEAPANFLIDFQNRGNARHLYFAFICNVPERDLRTRIMSQNGRQAEVK